MDDTQFLETVRQRLLETRALASNWEQAAKDWEESARVWKSRHDETLTHSLKLEAALKALRASKDVVPTPVLDLVATLVAAGGEANEALRDLLEIKTLKNRAGKTSEYLRRQPVAWQRATLAVRQWKKAAEKLK